VSADPEEVLDHAVNGREVAVTVHPTVAWTAQQLRNACPYDQVPRYFVHDRHHAFDGIGATATAMEIQSIVTAPRSPWQKDYVSYCTSFV